MRLVSEFLPDILPYHPHGKQSECHIAFWIYMASCDRVVPLARGGTSGLSNPVTSCYQCNSIKQSWLLSELRWEIRPAGSQWDGLSSSYEMLLDRLPGEKIAYYRDWRCALAAARRLVKNSSE